jgi:hypothetical protein
VLTLLRVKVGRVGGGRRGVLVVGLGSEGRHPGLAALVSTRKEE